jgi:two-component system cell cycle response regulator
MQKYSGLIGPVTLALAGLLCSWCATAEDSVTTIIHQLQAPDRQARIDPYSFHQYLESVQHDIESAPERVQAIYLLRKAEAELMQYRFDDFSHTLNQGKVLSDKDSEPVIRLWYDIYECLIYQRQANLAKTESCYRNTIASADALGDVPAAVHALQELAYAQILAEQYEQSMDSLLRAQQLAENANDSLSQAMVNQAYGAVYAYLDDYEKSVVYYQSALSTYRQLGLNSLIAETIYGLADAFRSWGKQDQARSLYQQFGELFRQYGKTRHQFLALYGLAMSQADAGECSESLDTIDQALRYPGLEDYLASLYRKQSLCLVETGRLPEARAALQTSVKLAEKLPGLHGSGWTLEHLQAEAVILAAEGDFRKAFALMSEFHQSYLRRYQQMASNRLAQMSITMENRNKDLVIERLQGQKLKASVELERQRQKTELQTSLTLTGLIVLCGACLFILYQRRVTRRFMDLSFHDGLTRLYNRRYIFELMDKLIANARPGRTQMSVILMDVDNFKMINDLYGHSTGDLVLCKLAEICLQELRAGDSVGRIGGEEFMIVVPREAEEQTRMIAERLRQVIEKSCVINDNNEVVRFTVSVGVSRLHPGCVDSAALFRQADAALYIAKRQGKNRIVEYTQSLMPELLPCAL